jgi:hypothetical protein
VAFRVFIADPSDGSTRELGTLPAVTGSVDNAQVTGKAEGITVLDMDADRIRAVVLFDALPNGAPHIAMIPLK